MTVTYCSYCGTAVHQYAGQGGGRGDDPRCPHGCAEDRYATLLTEREWRMRQQDVIRARNLKGPA